MVVSFFISIEGSDCGASGCCSGFMFEVVFFWFRFEALRFVVVEVSHRHHGSSMQGECQDSQGRRAPIEVL